MQSLSTLFQGMRKYMSAQTKPFPQWASGGFQSAHPLPIHYSFPSPLLFSVLAQRPLAAAAMASGVAAATGAGAEALPSSAGQSAATRPRSLRIPPDGRERCPRAFPPAGQASCAPESPSNHARPCSHRAERARAVYRQMQCPAASLLPSPLPSRPFLRGAPRFAAPRQATRA